jgi:hypothetical protein
MIPSLKLTVFAAFSASFLLAPGATAAESNSYSYSLTDWVPKGWKTLQQVKGDLNGDMLDDVVMVMEETNLSNIIKNDSLGPELLNINPRTLLVLFAQNQGYRKIATSDVLIPTANDTGSTCAIDPLEANALEIKKQTLRVGLSFFMSCGSWGTTRSQYIYRFDGKGMQLIGEEQMELQRNTGESTTASSNYLSGKKKETTVDAKGHIKTKWQVIKNNAREYLK